MMRGRGEEPNQSGKSSPATNPRLAEKLSEITQLRKHKKKLNKKLRKLQSIQQEELLKNMIYWNIINNS